MNHVIEALNAHVEMLEEATVKIADLDTVWDLMCAHNLEEALVECIEHYRDDEMDRAMVWAIEVCPYPVVPTGAWLAQNTDTFWPRYCELATATYPHVKEFNRLLAGAHDVDAVVTQAKLLVAMGVRCVPSVNGGAAGRLDWFTDAEMVADHFEHA